MRSASSAPAILAAVATLAAVTVLAANVDAQRSVVYAASYSARQDGDVVHLEDTAARTRVSIASSVGNIAFAMTVNGQNILHWPYASLDEFRARPAMSGVPFMGPWANRLDEQAFYANGQRYAFDMSLGNVRGAIPIHGFLTTTDRWRRIETRADAGAAWTTSRLEFSRYPDWMKQWPFAHTIEMTYRLERGSLEVRTRIVNESAQPMPVAIGFHPYFRLTDSPRDEWTLSVGARTHWLLAPTKIPTGQTEPIETFLPPAAALRDRELDDVFGDLVRDDRGRATVAIAGKSQRLAVTLDSGFRAVVVWAPKQSPFICLEPMAGITDAINLAHRGLYDQLQQLAPAGTWQGSFWITPAGF